MTAIGYVVTAALSLLSGLEDVPANLVIDEVAKETLPAVNRSTLGKEPSILYGESDVENCFHFSDAWKQFSNLMKIGNASLHKNHTRHGTANKQMDRFKYDVYSNLDSVTKAVASTATPANTDAVVGTKRGENTTVQPHQSTSTINTVQSAKNLSKTSESTPPDHSTLSSISGSSTLKEKEISVTSYSSPERVGRTNVHVSSYFGLKSSTNASMSSPILPTDSSGTYSTAPTKTTVVIATSSAVTSTSVAQQTTLVPNNELSSSTKLQGEFSAISGNGQHTDGTTRKPAETPAPRNTFSSTKPDLPKLSAEPDAKPGSFAETSPNVYAEIVSTEPSKLTLIGDNDTQQRHHILTNSASYTVKLVVTIVFVTVAGVALAFMAVLILRRKRTVDVYYDELRLLP